MGKSLWYGNRLAVSSLCTNWRLQVLQDIAGLLQTIGKVRSQEAYTFFINVFLPAQNWPTETALEFTTRMRDFDSKQFRKYFVDFVRASRSSS
jgi:exportin-T